MQRNIAKKPIGKLKWNSKDYSSNQQQQKRGK